MSSIALYRKAKQAYQAYIICNPDPTAQVLLLGDGHLIDLWLCQVWVVQDVVQQHVSMVLHVSHLMLQHHVKHEQPWQNWHKEGETCTCKVCIS